MGPRLRGDDESVATTTSNPHPGPPPVDAWTLGEGEGQFFLGIPRFLLDSDSFDRFSFLLESCKLTGL